jgi:hypothetical protein
MISVFRPHRRPVLSPRAPARHEDPLSPAHPMRRILPQITPPSVRKALHSGYHAIVVRLRPRLLTGDPGPGQSASWVKSP